MKLLFQGLGVVAKFSHDSRKNEELRQEIAVLAELRHSSIVAFHGLFTNTEGVNLFGQKSF